MEERSYRGRRQQCTAYSRVHQRFSEPDSTGDKNPEG